jgi:hypothetical protein
MQKDIVSAIKFLIERDPVPKPCDTVVILAFVWIDWSNCFAILSNESLLTLIDDSLPSLLMSYRSEELQTSFLLLMSLYFIMSLTDSEAIPVDELILTQIYFATQDQ